MKMQSPPRRVGATNLGATFLTEGPGLDSQAVKDAVRAIDFQNDDAVDHAELNPQSWPSNVTGRLKTALDEAYRQWPEGAFYDLTPDDTGLKTDVFVAISPPFNETMHGDAGIDVKVYSPDGQLVATGSHNGKTWDYDWDG